MHFPWVLVNLSKAKTQLDGYGTSSATDCVALFKFYIQFPQMEIWLGDDDVFRLTGWKMVRWRGRPASRPVALKRRSARFSDLLSSVSHILMNSNSIKVISYFLPLRFNLLTVLRWRRGCMRLFCKIFTMNVRFLEIELLIHLTKLAFL